MKAHLHCNKPHKSECLGMIQWDVLEGFGKGLDHNPDVVRVRPWLQRRQYSDSGYCFLKSDEVVPICHFWYGLLLMMVCWLPSDDR